MSKFFILTLLVSTPLFAKKRECKVKYIVGNRSTSFISIGTVGGFLANKKKKCAELARKKAMEQIKKNKDRLALQGCEPNIEYYADTEVDGKTNSKDVKGRVSLGNCAGGNIETEVPNLSSVCFAQYEYKGLRTPWKNHGKVKGLFVNKKNKCKKLASGGGAQTFIQSEYDKECNKLRSPKPSNARRDDRGAEISRPYLNSILGVPCGRTVEFYFDTKFSSKIMSRDGKVMVNLKCCKNFALP